mmetsp:Transcript_32468/g.76280  ORF Transcript_32468/g.76280 Transcript_32468/m.76280 type:complete len:142 (-) Transcript_32468:11-436(-)
MGLPKEGLGMLVPRLADALHVSRGVIGRMLGSALGDTAHAEAREMPGAAGTEDGRCGDLMPTCQVEAGKGASRRGVTAAAHRGERGDVSGSAVALPPDVGARVDDKPKEEWRGESAYFVLWSGWVLPGDQSRLASTPRATP